MSNPEFDNYIIQNQGCFTMRQFDIDTSYKDAALGDVSFSDYLLNSPQLIEQINSRNLVLIASKCDVDKSKPFIDELAKRQLEGERVFAGGRIDGGMCGLNFEYNSVAFKGVLNSLLEHNEIDMRDKMRSELGALKESAPECYAFLDQCKNGISLLVVESFMAQYEKGNITPEVLDKLNGMVKDCPNAVATMDFGICDPEILSMNDAFLKRAIRYKNFSTELVTIHEESPELFKLMADKINELETTLSEREASNIEKAMVKQIALNSKDMRDATSQDMDSIVEFSLIKDRSDFYSRDLKYSGQFTDEYLKACDEEFKNALPHNKLDVYSKKFFGQDLFRTKREFDQKFSGIDRSSLQDKNLEAYLKKIASVVEVSPDDAKAVEEVTSDYYIGERDSALQIEHYREQANVHLLKTYEQGFINTEQALATTQDYTMIDHNGTQIKQINLPDKFQLVVRSTDTEFKDNKIIVNDSFKESERYSNPSVYLKSSCIINQDFTGLAPLGQNGTYFVFIDNNSLNMGEIGVKDIDSNVADYGVSSNKGRFVEADKFNDNTRKIYAEATIYSRDPDAIMLLSDGTDIQKENAYKAAAEYGVPVIFMDKERVADRQVESLAKLKEQFEQTGDLAVLQKLVSNFESNIAGWLLNRDTSKPDETCTQNIDNTVLAGKYTEIENGIYKTIADYCKVQHKLPDGKDRIMQVARILQEEEHKYDDINGIKTLTDVTQKLKSHDLLQIMNKNYDLGLDLEQSKADTLGKLFDEKESTSQDKGNGFISLESIVTEALSNGLVDSHDLERVGNLLQERGQEYDK